MYFSFTQEKRTIRLQPGAKGLADCAAMMGSAMRKIATLAIALFVVSAGAAAGQTPSELAPTGTLRVAMLVVNPVLVTKMKDGTLGGISVELGRLIAAKLGARYQEVPYQSTEAFAKSFGAGEWDIAIGPKTPIAEKSSDFSPPFMLVENIYVAAPGRKFANATEVDRAGVRIAVVVNGAPDQFLSKNLKAATLVRVQGANPEIVEALRSGKADVYGSNAENVYEAAASLPGSTVLPGAFRTVSMVVAYPKGKSQGVQRSMDAIVSEAKSSGLVKRSIESAHLKGVRPAE